MINYSFITDKLTKLQTEIIGQFIFHKSLLSIHEVYSAIRLLEIKSLQYSQRLENCNN